MPKTASSNMCAIGGKLGTCRSALQKGHQGEDKLETLKISLLGVSEMASATVASAIDVCIDDVGSRLKFRIGFPFGENSAGFCQSVWLIGPVSSIGGLIAATLFADTISDPQIYVFISLNISKTSVQPRPIFIEAPSGPMQFKPGYYDGQFDN